MIFLFDSMLVFELSFYEDIPCSILIKQKSHFYFQKNTKTKPTINNTLTNSILHAKKQSFVYLLSTPMNHSDYTKSTF